jgi:hypothetical protein
MIRRFPRGASILVQLGFYDFFATINVLTFSCGESTSSEDKEFINECLKMKLESHIVSFSYDFHLRYIQELVQSKVNLTFDLIRVLRSFITLNGFKARFSRNRLYFSLKKDCEGNHGFRKNKLGLSVPIYFKELSIL